MPRKNSKLNLKLDTVRTAIETGSISLTNIDLFFGHGTATAIDEAAYLVSFVIGYSPIIPEDILDKELTEKQKDKIYSIFEIRINNKIPAAYITHESWFAGYQFYVDERVLVPRSPIAELINDNFSPWISISEWDNSEKPITVLDLCTGSGCIAIATALAIPNSNVHASDISEDALKVAKINVENYELINRVTLIKSDIFEQLEPFHYDLILSNPPYVDAQDMSTLQSEFLAEPQLGLEAGNNGLDIVIPLLSDATRYLTENGIIIIEVGNSANALQKLFPEIPFMWLEFEYGGDGVFLLEANQVRKYHNLFQQQLK